MRTWGPIPLGVAGSPQSAMGAVVTATSLPVTMISSTTTAHAKGAWTELFASTGFNTTLIDLIVAGTGLSGANRHMLCDIGIGPNGSETVLVPNILIGTNNATRRYTCPIWIPAGTRVAVRYQTNTTSLAIGVQAEIHNTGNAQADTGSSATAYGANTGTSSGTALTAPGAINTLGAWTQIVASTGAAARALLIACTGPAGASWSPAASALLGVGYGPGGAETSLLDGLAFSWTTAEMTDGVSLTLPVNLPINTRLVARYQATDLTQQPLVSLVAFT